MSSAAIVIQWGNGRTSRAEPGDDWLAAARQAGFPIPTGCLGGSCGACEIEVNGRLLRACIARVPRCREGRLRVDLASDPHW